MDEWLVVEELGHLIVDEHAQLPASLLDTRSVSCGSDAITTCRSWAVGRPDPAGVIRTPAPSGTPGGMQQALDRLVAHRESMPG